MNSIQFLANTVEKAFNPAPADDPKSSLDLDDSQIVTRQLDRPEPSAEEDKPVYDEEEENDDRSVLGVLVSILFFFPKHLVINPTVWVLLVVTYPLRAIIGLVRHTDPTVQQNIDKPAVEARVTQSEVPQRQKPREDPVQTQITTIVEEDIEFELDKSEDPIKSPTGPLTSSSDMVNPQALPQASGRKKNAKTSGTSTPRKKKFIFPKLLFNFNINYPPNLPQKTLVLDLDETLIHSLSRHNSSILNKNKGTTLEIRINNQLATLYHIYKRPYVDEFLSIVRNWFNLVCFTASIKEYADPVINYLEQEVMLKDKGDPAQKKDLFSQRFYRNSCIFTEGRGYVKDLGVLTGQQKDRASTPSTSPYPPGANNSSENIAPVRDRSVSRTRGASGIDLSKVIIIDNSPISYSFHKKNGIMIEGWINDPEDSELMNLLPLLNSLRFTSDVRNILGLKLGQEVFE
ncbi:hypothetical protein OGAPHI_006973 [Ogataea philodendri]|uniref:Mitochondrial import inner membrane translocase subunit TIM50 n=1 Tax=Ogataea philodendri TaxID=1378263 RepID=A0A9P8NWA8_9ASCO|nr:uncharacterized protein OGAPHI_006973 [Ogataea philodendri]KAH3660387.1 hypothetical protein OGAPHI_006973 [Ogataea philodendri]